MIWYIVTFVIGFLLGVWIESLLTQKAEHEHEKKEIPETECFDVSGTVSPDFVDKWKNPYGFEIHGGRKPTKLL